MEIIVVWPYELETPNRAPYQRIKALSNHFNVCIISMMKNKIDNQIRKKINRIISVDININQKIKYILYLFKMIVTLFSYSFNKKQVSIYIIYNWLIFPVMIISIVFRIKIFVDFLDDPNLMEQVYKIKKDGKIKYYIYKFINILFKRFALNNKYIIGFCSIGMNKSSLLPIIYSKRYNILVHQYVVLFYQYPAS